MSFFTMRRPYLEELDEQPETSVWSATSALTDPSPQIPLEPDEQLARKVHAPFNVSPRTNSEPAD